MKHATLLASTKKSLSAVIDQLGTIDSTKSPFIACLTATCVVVSANAYAQEPNTKDKPTVLAPLEVIDFGAEHMDGLKYSRDLPETPRLITVLPSDLLEEQGTTSLKDALKNIPGISMQAGEGNPPSGDQFKIRGFNARDDIRVDGMRDPGNYFRDPFFVEQLEVVKGPNSTFAGRGSAGGTVNFVSKQPQQQDFNRVEVGVGTDSYKRLTLDANKKINDNSALRLNVMKHGADIPGRDIANEDRYGVHAAYTWGFKGPTKITADYLHMRMDDLPDAGLPTNRAGNLGPVLNNEASMANVKRENFYGHTNDYKKVDVDQVGVGIQHQFSGGTLVSNKLRLAQVHNDGWVSSPRIAISGAGPVEGGSCSSATPCGLGNTKPRDQVDEALNNQLDVAFGFKTGSIQHDMVMGVEVSKNSYDNKRRLDNNGPRTSLINPVARYLTSVPTYDGTRYRLETEEMGVYLLDTMRLNPKWDLHAGLRWDKVSATATRRGFTGANSVYNTTHKRDDDALSQSLSLVYKLTPDMSIYGTVSNAYVMSANFDRNSVQLAGGSATESIVGAGFNTAPEEMQSFELGAKWRTGKSLDIGAALFRTDVTNGRLPGQDGGTSALPTTKYHIDGFELLASGKLSDKWNLYGGYTYLTNEITAAPSAGANEAYVKGQKLGNTPEHSFSLFTLYDVTPKVTLGGGLRHVGSVTSGVDPAPGGNSSVRVAGYTATDLYGAYKFTKQTQVRMNVFNLTDEYYIDQLAEGGGQGIPGKARQVVFTLRHDF